jgi:hypothetical protein
MSLQNIGNETNIEGNIEFFENTIQTFISNLFSSSYIEEGDFSDSESDYSRNTSTSTSSISLENNTDITYTSITGDQKDITDKYNDEYFQFVNEYIYDDHNYKLPNNIRVVSKSKNDTLNENKVSYRINNEQYDYTKKCYPNVDFDHIKKNENKNNNGSKDIANNNIVNMSMKTLAKEEKQRILTTLKNLCYRFDVVSTLKPHDKLWIKKTDNEVIKFEIDSTYWFKPLTQPLYRTYAGQGRVEIINQIIRDTNNLINIYPQLSDKKQNTVKKIIEREGTDGNTIGTIMGLENMKQMYSNHKDKINQIIANLRSIINQKNEIENLNEINNNVVDDPETEQDEDLIKTLENDLK